LLSLVLQGLALCLPALASVLETEPLERGDWWVILAAGLVPLLVGQLFRLWRGGSRAEAVP
jgi:hypothetical protein